jgi:MFS family permease
MTTLSAAASDPTDMGRTLSMDDSKVIMASCAGTICEWYDFFLYGALATLIGAKFFGQFDETTRNIFALLTFALGFVVRPIGGLLFGRFGDLLGRKNIFLVTVVGMGATTFAVGLIPTSSEIGIAAPIALVALRVLQGLAISGEFGGAVIYVAEHAPAGRRGFYTGWIPACIGLSLLLALVVVLATQSAMSVANFDAWGWRLPFLGSAVLLVISVVVRSRLQESPAFLKIKAEGRHSKAPISEAFGKWSNARLAVVALFGITAGVAATGYAGTFYVLVFMTSALKLDGFTANLLFAVAMLFGSGCCVFFGWLSDKVGRKPVILAGCLLAVVGYSPVFRELTAIANPALLHAQETISVTIKADPETCSLLFNPAGAAKYTSACDLAKSTLARASVAYRSQGLPPGAPTSVEINEMPIALGDNIGKSLEGAIVEAGYPPPGHPDALKLTRLTDVFASRPLTLIGLLLFLVICAQLTQGPAAAALVELFPTRIRYTSMSLPYQIGTGWIGGLLPATMVAMNAASGDMFFGLWYPVTIAAVTFLVGLFFLPETRDADIAA